MFDATHERLERAKERQFEGFVLFLGRMFLNDSFKHCDTGEIDDELTIERVCLLMNIVPCEEIILAS